MFLVPLALAGTPTVCPEAAALGWREEAGVLYDPASLEVAGEPSLVAMGHLSRLVRTLESRGAAVSIVLLPSRPVGFAPPAGWDLALDRRKYVATREWLQSIGAVVPDVWALARKGAFYMPDEGHWTPQAARATAELLRAEVGAIPGLGGEPHETRELRSSRPEPGLLSKRLAVLCKTVPAEHPRPRFQTTGPALGLLDEAPPPPIAMIAPSYGDEEFNFGGALADAFDAGVLPVAVHGGMVMSGMQTWMQSENYAARQTKLVVWVVQIGHLFGVGGGGDRVSLVDGEGWRQVLGRARGPCDAPPLGADGRLPTPLSTAGRYLQLDGAGLAGAKFSTRITHTDGTVDEVDTVPDPRVAASPTQFVELRQSAIFPVSSVSIDVKEVTIRVCGEGPAAAPAPSRPVVAAPELCPAAKAAGWTADNGAIFPPGQLSPAVRTDVETLGYLSRFLGILRERGLQVSIGLLPTRAGAFAPDGARSLGGRTFSPQADRERYVAVAQWLRERGAVVPDLWVVARGMPDFFPPDGALWSAAGGAAIGRALGIAPLVPASAGEFGRKVAELCGAPAAQRVEGGVGPMLAALRERLAAIGTEERFSWIVPIAQVVGDQAPADWRQLLPEAAGACIEVGAAAKWSGPGRGHFVAWEGPAEGVFRMTHADGTIDAVSVKKSARRLEFDQAAASPVASVEGPGKAARVCRYR